LASFRRRQRVARYPSSRRRAGTAPHAAINWSSWTITVYALAQIIALPTAGALSDIYGRKKLFLIAVTIFTASSLCCGTRTPRFDVVGIAELGSGLLAVMLGISLLGSAPERAASISGLRGMFRQAGGIAGLAVTSTVLARSANPGHTQALAFTFLALALLLLIPLAFFIPDHRLHPGPPGHLVSRLAYPA
jgi:MFS family permease